MPVPHFNIKITQRSKGNSAVAGAAYQAGEKLFSEYDQKTKNYTCKKEVVYTEIMLPPNAPPEYADRATLWNSVEEIEKQWNSQLARRFVAALPREVPMELLPQMVKEYCEEQFVSKGMCCDFAIHDPDPPGHNPHCHFMLTMRAIDENGKWMPKSRKVYDLDENGERIKLPSGRWKSHKEDTVDWNEQYHAEEWRHGWEIVQNKYLELAGSPERIDMRSYERQGLDIIPTVHMGTAVSALERKGIATNIGNLNRDIKAANRMMNAIRSTIKSLRDWIADILEATKEVIAENEAEKKNASPNLAVLLRDYLNLRKAERSEWSRYGQQKGTTDDLKTISQATVYLQRHELFTLEDLDIALQGVSEKATAIREDMQKAANRMKAITAIQTAVADCEKHKAVHDKYIKIGWKIRKEAYVESHKDELTAFNKAYRILKKHGADLNVDLKALQKEYDGLRTMVFIPSNLWIIATMNTADQNVFTLDTAFQRRWMMKHIENDVMSAKHANDKIEGSLISWGVFATVINEEILKVSDGVLSSEDKRLGAYFITKQELSTERFPEKVLKYLWDDAFKMNRDSLFAAECNSFDAVTAMYRSKSDKDPLSQIINQSVYTEMLNRMNNLA